MFVIAGGAGGGGLRWWRLEGRDQRMLLNMVEAQDNRPQQGIVQLRWVSRGTNEGIAFSCRSRLLAIEGSTYGLCL